VGCSFGHVSYLLANKVCHTMKVLKNNAVTEDGAEAGIVLGESLSLVDAMYTPASPLGIALMPSS
jgi:hypothetical protein